MLLKYLAPGAEACYNGKKASEGVRTVEEKYVFITNESLPVTLPEKAAFVTQDTEIISSNCIKAREEGAKLTYVIMK